MPDVAVIEHPRPAVGTTLSVLDGTVSPAPRPQTVISVGPAGTATESADVVVVQTGPQSVEITAAGRRYEVDMEFFRAENRYVGAGSRRWPPIWKWWSRRCRTPPRLSLRAGTSIRRWRCSNPIPDSSATVPGCDGD